MESVSKKLYKFRLFCLWGIFIFFGPYAEANAQEKKSDFNVVAHRENNFYSFKELRNKNTLRQRYDFSCGAASVATILKYYFGSDVTEREVIIEMLSNLSKSEFDSIKEKGFSLLDMKHLVESYGFWAHGYYLNFDHLRHIKYPIMLFIEQRGYKHFVVCKGVYKNHIYISDPSWGNRMTHISRFAKNWDGIALVILPISVAPNFLTDQTLTLPEKITKSSAFRNMNRSLEFIK